MLEVIVAAICRTLMSVHSGCHNFCNGSCVSLCIIDVPRNQIVNNILEINGTVQKTNNYNLEDKRERIKCNKFD